MALPALVQDAVYGSDFRIGSGSYTPTITFIGDSRVYGLKGDLTHRYPDYLSLHTFNGETIAKVNRAFESITAEEAVKITNGIGPANNVLSALTYYGSINIVVIGPIGVNDLSFNGRSISDIQEYNRQLCLFYRGLGCKVIWCSEVSSVTTVGGVTGDDIKNYMRSWAIAGGTGNEYWRTFADAYIDPGNFPPFGQNGVGSNGCLNSTYYDVDGVHWKDAGHQAFASGVQDVINDYIDSIASSYTTPRPSSLLNHEARLKTLESTSNISYVNVDTSGCCGTIDVRQYGAIPDAIKVSAGSCTGTSFSSPLLALVSADVGKSIRIVTGYNSDVNARSTISNVASAHGGSMANTVLIANTSATANIYYGTNNATALAAAFASAANIENPTTVIGPSLPDGGAYMIDTPVSANAINVDFDAWIYNNVTVSGSNQVVPLNLGNSNIDKLRMDAAGGMGIRWGSSAAHDLHLTDLSVINVAFGGQTGMKGQGFGFNIAGDARVQGGSKGFDWTNCQDIHGQGCMNAIGSNRPHIINQVEDGQFNLVSDTTTDNAFEVDACRNVKINATSFVNGSNTACTGKIGSVSTTYNRAINIDYLAQAGGGPALYVDYIGGGFQANITATNKPTNSGTVNPITYAVQYGTHVSGACGITTTRDTDIPLFTGTQYGSLHDLSGDDYYSSNILLAGKIALTSTVPANITSVALPAGKWLCYGNVLWEVAGTASWGILALNTSSATLPTAPNEGGYAVSTLVMNAGYFPFSVVRRYDIPAGGGTVYLIADMQFTSTTNVYGSLNCQRVQ